MTLVKGGVADPGGAGLKHRQIHFGHSIRGTFGSTKWTCPRGSEAQAGAQARKAAREMENDTTRGSEKA